MLSFFKVGSGSPIQSVLVQQALYRLCHRRGPGLLFPMSELTKRSQHVPNVSSHFTREKQHIVTKAWGVQKSKGKAGC